MRITLVCPYDPNPAHAYGPLAAVGGVERVYAQTARRLAARGHAVTIVCSTDGPGHVAVEEGVVMVRRPRRMSVLRAPVANLAHAVPEDSELVQVAATYPFTTPPTLRRMHRLGVPSVLDFHFEPSPPGILGRTAAAAYRQVGPATYKYADVALVRSMSYARSAPSLATVPEERWRIVPNGVDTDRFTPSRAGEGQEFILFVGRLVPYKGLDVLLHALHRRPSHLPLLLAGDGPQRRHLEALAAKLGVRARFLGRVTDDELVSLYQRAAVTVLPSVNRQEAFGISLLESMACGTPVVASDLPGVAQVARIGGAVAPPGDPGRLAAQIHRVLESDVLPHGRALAAAVAERYSWDAVTDRLEAVYEEVLGRRERPFDLGAQPEVMAVAHPGGQPVL